MQSSKDKGIKTVKVKVKIKLKRSATKPITKADKKLSVKHLKDSMAYNKRHIKDHKTIEKKGGSKKYNEDHIKEHQKQLKKDKKLLEKRKKNVKKRPTAAKAKTMLKDNSAQGHPLTKKQKGYFGWIAGGSKKRGLPKQPQAATTPYFPTPQTGTKSIGGFAQPNSNPNAGLINPTTRAKKRLLRGMKGHTR